MKEVIFIDECPECRSQSITYDTIEPVEDQMMQKIKCLECLHEFKIWSKTKWVYEVEE